MKLIRESKSVLALIFLLGFGLYFSYDLYALKRAFYHHDIMDTYFPFRHWFTERLLNGEFPLWNPYWGIGNATEIWATIPIDIFTLFEWVLGVHPYHYFQGVQLLLLLTAGFYSFRKLDFHALVAAAGIIFFFMSPHVTYFYFYFIKTNLFLCLPLSLAFIYLWFTTEKIKYLFYLYWTVVFSMFGTKLEFWFTQTFALIFICFCIGIVVETKRSFFRVIWLPLASIAAGILTHLWQLNILLRVVKHSGRLNEASLKNVFLGEMYQNIFLSVVESRLIQMLIVCAFLYVGASLKGRQSYFCFFMGILTAIIFKVWQIDILASFLNGPIFYGFIAGMGLAAVLYRDYTWRDYLKTTLLFWVFIYYWCRPEVGALEEMTWMRNAPYAFSLMLAALVWLGCTQFQKNRLVRISWMVFLLILLMRVQGNIVLAYLTGFLWIPFRDNYLLSFFVCMVAMSGLMVLGEKGRWKTIQLEGLGAVLSIGIVIWSAWPDLYYAHKPMLQTPPPDYPYYKGVKKFNDVFKEIRKKGDERIYLDPFNGTFGFESALWAGIGQVTLHTSLNPDLYKRWSTYKRLGIRPEEKWGGYYSTLGEKRISQLPKQNTQGRSNDEVYFYNLNSRPKMEKASLGFLGVSHVGLIKSVPWSLAGGLMLPSVPENWFELFQKQLGAPLSYLDSYKDLNDLVAELDLVEVKESDWMVVGRLRDSLPRAFFVDGVSRENQVEFEADLDSIFDQDVIRTKTSEFPVIPVEIIQYKPENVIVRVEDKEERHLVLADLYHPFWHVEIDGKEVELLQAFYLYRAVKVPPGSHSVQFYCEIPHLKACILISLSMLILSVVLYCALARKRNTCAQVTE